MTKTDYCHICQTEKRVTLVAEVNDQMTMKDVSVSEYRFLRYGQDILGIFCPQCGILYHPESVQLESAASEPIAPIRARTSRH
jgi:hypothetical protein